MRRQSSRRTRGAIGTNLLLKSVAVTMGLLAAGIFGMAPSAFADDDEVTNKGTLLCIAAQRMRMGGSQITFSGVALRNFDPRRTITIDEITVYSGDGIVRKQLTNTDPTKNFKYAINVAGFKTTLGPHESTLFTTTDLTGGSINPNFHPAQIVIEWSSDGWYGGLELWGNTGRLDAPVGTNSSGHDVPGVINSRGNLRCAAIAGSGDRDRERDDD